MKANNMKLSCALLGSCDINYLYSEDLMHTCIAINKPTNFILWPYKTKLMHLKAVSALTILAVCKGKSSVK